MSAAKVPSCRKDALPCTVTLGDRPLWVTLSGELQARCRIWKLHGDALRNRLEQLLGMPVGAPSQYLQVAFVEFRVARHRLARPCLGVDASDPAQLVCTLDAQPATRADHYGASEFIVLPTSTVEALAVASIDDYCRAP